MLSVVRVACPGIALQGLRHSRRGLVISAATASADQQHYREQPRGTWTFHGTPFAEKHGTNCGKRRPNCLPGGRQVDESGGLAGAPPRFVDEIDERPQRSGEVTASGIIKKGSGEALPPGLENGFQGAALEIGTQPIFK